MVVFLPYFWYLKFYMHGIVAQNLPLYFLERIIPHAFRQCYHFLS
uniref:Uncharacterized protein n=1 Tax=Arundo donax TaxID=35708 RepID=A0A0A9H780_ARUDO